MRIVNNRNLLQFNPAYIKNPANNLIISVFLESWQQFWEVIDSSKFRNSFSTFNFMEIFKWIQG